MVTLVTDMSVPKDVTHIRVKVKRDDEVREERDFFVAPDGQFFLPGTIAVIEGSTPAPVVSVEVVGIRTPESGPAEARTFSKVTTTIPRERIALLRVPVQWLCDETAVDDGTGSYATSCPPIDGKEAACVAGRCQLVKVDSDALPTFDARDVFGGGESADDPLARCFDTLECFDRGVDVDRDDLGDDCTLELDDEGAHNVALRLAEGEAGICHGTGQEAPCYVPLDQDELWGWRYEEDAPEGKVRLALPPAVCDRLDNGIIEAVRVTTVCETKTARYPTCGPWSAVTESNSGDGGAGGSGGAGSGGTNTTGDGGSGGSVDSGGSSGSSVGGSDTGSGATTGNTGEGGAAGEVSSGGASVTSGGGTSSASGGTGQVSECQDPLVFADPIVEDAVRYRANVATDPLTAEAVAGVTILSLTGVTDLDGIQCLPNLSSVDVFDSERPNIAPLGATTSLYNLGITRSGLPDLTPLGSLNTLNTLRLTDNRISDVSALASLTNLQALHLADNAITDVTPLRSLTSLLTLRLERNSLTDVSALGSLTSLTTLYLQENDISDVTELGSLPNLEWLDLSDNSIGDVTELGSLTSLTHLLLGSTGISDVTELASLTSLILLDVSGNAVNDITVLASLTNLRAIELSANDITDVSALGSLPLVTDLWLGSNNITDVTALGSRTTLLSLDLSDNAISDISLLGGLTNLTSLMLSSNDINDIEALETLTKLIYLYLDNNSISDLSALEAPQDLVVLNLASNDINDLAPLADNTGLDVGSVDVTDNPFDCSGQAVSISTIEERGVAVYSDCP